MNLFERNLPLSFEPVSTAVDDIIVLDSDVEDDGYCSATKRRRVEEIGHRYLQGQTINVFAAGLRGSFEHSWANPWRKKGVGAHTWKRLPQRTPLTNGHAPSQHRTGKNGRNIRDVDDPRGNALYEATEAAVKFGVEPEKNITDRKRPHVMAETDDGLNEACYIKDHDDCSEGRCSPEPFATSIHIVNDGGHEDQGSRRDDRRQENHAKFAQSSTPRTITDGPNLISSNHDTAAQYTSLSRYALPFSHNHETIFRHGLGVTR